MTCEQKSQTGQLEIAELPYGPELEAVYQIRNAVFVDEQHLTSNARSDPDDRRSIHYIAKIDGQPVGTGRLTILGREAQIAWVAVVRAHRGNGIGWAVMERLIDRARQENSDYIILNAQVHAREFYRRLGFRTVGEEFMMARIPHQVMVRQLSDRGAGALQRYSGQYGSGGGGPIDDWE